MKLKRVNFQPVLQQYKAGQNSLHARLPVAAWNDAVKDSGLFFFAHSLAEMLFHHSHDSLKVNTLNFRFLWYDLLQVIDDIENGILDKGNIEPFIDEIVLFYSNDQIARSLYGDDIATLYRTKDASGKYVDKYNDIFSNRTSEATIALLKKVGIFLQNDLTGSDKYYIFLIEFIKGLCNNHLTFEQERDLYLLTQSLLSELINRDYSQEYIFRIVMHTFFSESQITTPNETIDKFLSNFTFNRRNYVVYFPLTSRAKCLICDDFQIDVCENHHEMFSNNYPYVGKISTKAFDPEQARLIASESIELIFSIVQYEKHQEHTFFVADAEVIDIETKECYPLRRPIPPILRENGHIDKTCFLKEKCPHRIRNLFNAIELHSSALRSNNINNQLLNLWTAIEVLIPVERHGSFGKINQICNSLSSILGIRYFSSLLLQFEFDIRSVCDQKLSELFQSVKAEMGYQKLAILLTQKEHAHDLQILKEELSSHPVLSYRASYYANIFSDMEVMQKVYATHVKKLRCQIMRVYRCRNMIVHDGMSVRYIELIIQNLHFYFDTLVDTIYKYAKQDILHIEAICQKVSQDEINMIRLMSKKIVDSETLLKIIG